MNSSFVVYYYNRNELLFWARHINYFAKVKLYLEVVFKTLPRNLLAWFHAKEKEVFKSHIASNIDFLFKRLGKKILD